MYKLAVVIPYYKEKFFEECLNSLAEQTDKRFSVYIGNDASQEDPIAIISKYKGQFNLNYFPFQENLGTHSLVEQWERCLDMVKKEEWVMILGDDDKLEKNVISSFYSCLPEVQRQKIYVVRYASSVINSESEMISGPYVHPKFERSTDFLMRRLAGKTRSSLSEYIFNRKKLTTTRFKKLPLGWYADLLGVLEVSMFKHIYTINSALVLFRSSGVNISSKKDNLKEKNIATFNFFYYLLSEKKEYFNRFEKECLFKKLEKTFLDNKKNIRYWFEFAGVCFSNGQYLRYIFFLQRLSSNVLNKIMSK